MHIPKYTVKIIETETDGMLLTTPVLIDKETLKIEPIASLFLLAMRKREKGNSLKTAEAHASTICLLINEVVRDPDIGDWRNMTDSLMYRFFEHKLFRERRIGGATLEAYRTRLKALYRWSFKNGWLKDNPKISFRLCPEAERSVMRAKGSQKSIDPFGLHSQYIPHEEFKTLLSYKTRVGSFECERDDIILKLGYYSGFRAAETVSPDNISIKKIKNAIAKAEKEEQQGFWMTIIGKGKHGGKSRIIYVPEHLKQQILRFITGTRKRTVGTESGLLICKKSGDTLKNESHASKIFNKAKLALLASAPQTEASYWVENPQRRFHSLRHSYATNLAFICTEKGWPMQIVMDRMGHTSLETSNIYLHFAALYFNLEQDGFNLDNMPTHIKKMMFNDMADD